LVRAALVLLPFFVGAVLIAGPASAWDRGQTRTFAVVPNLPGRVPVDIEGLTVGPDGTVYTPSFGVNAKGPVAGPPHLFSFRPDGRLRNDVALVNPVPTPAPQPSATLLGLVFQPSSKSLLICDLAQGISGWQIRLPANRACSWQPGWAPPPASTGSPSTRPGMSMSRTRFKA
jgi:hypothetical protein